MLDDRRLVKVSRYLSKHLRHEPERIGLTLDSAGWVSVDDLLAALAKHQMSLTREELNEVVTLNDKQRFAFDETGTMIRASQGHTVEVDLELEPIQPPDTLFHGTGVGSLTAILETGLSRMDRHHVHLSPDMETAVKVGQRHGRPVVLLVDTKRMAADGFTFYRSANGVWLVDHVPPEYLKQTN